MTQNGHTNRCAFITRFILWPRNISINKRLPNSFGSRVNAVCNTPFGTHSTSQLYCLFFSSKKNTGRFDEIVEDCGKFKYRAGLNEIIKKGEGSQKKAHYTDLDIVINGNEHFRIQLLSMQAGEIKKLTQPSTRKKKIGCLFIFVFFLKVPARS